MPYQERGSGSPHFDGKNYQMWSKRMAAFLCVKGQSVWDVTVDTSYVQPMNFLAPGSRDMFDANNKAVDYLIELRKLMGWLSGHESQLRIMIETYKRQDGEGLGANKVGEGSGENIPEPPKTHHKNDFPRKPNHLRN
jgi:hypothetical protein